MKLLCRFYFYENINFNYCFNSNLIYFIQFDKNRLSIISTEYHYLNTLVHLNVYTVGVICGQFNLNLLINIFNEYYSLNIINFRKNLKKF